MVKKVSKSLLQHDNFEEFFRVVGDYAGNEGYDAGYPTFKEDNGNYEVVLLKNTIVEPDDAPWHELRDPPNNDLRFVSLNNYAQSFSNPTKIWWP